MNSNTFSLNQPNVAMNPSKLSLQLNESIVGDIVFMDDNGMQIESNSGSRKSKLMKSWNLSKTGSFEMKGLKIKNGIHGVPDDENLLCAVSDLHFLGELGVGAVGTVKKAMLISSGEVLAVKCIDLFDANSRKQFMDEISLFLKLKHPSIVSFKGCCINGETEQLYLALEYCSNGSLHSFLSAPENGGSLTEPQIKKLSVEIVSALSFLEFNKIIHRDIKPHNILLDEQLNAKLADFGIQKNLVKSFANTQCGTMSYMSPQRMEGRKYSFKSDVWSFGLTLLFCVYGRFPYNTENKKMSLLEMHIAIVEDEVPPLPPTDKNGKPFSIEFRSFIQACLYKQAAKRWKASDLLMHPFLM